MTHDQEIENHPFFKKHFAGKSTKEYHEIPHDGGSAGYHQWTAHHGIGLTPVKHKLFHRYHPETNSHSVLLTTGTEGRNILGNHTYHSGEGDGSSATEALEKAIHQYKNDHGFHLQENMDQFASNKRETNMKDFRDFVKTTYAGLMEVEGLNEARKILPITDAIKNHPDTESKLGLSSRVSNDQRKTKTYTTHSMSFYTHHPKLNYVRVEHVHQPSSKYSTGEHHVVHITGFPKEDLPSSPDGAGTALYGGGEGGTAHEAYDKAIKAFDPNAR